MYSNREYRHRSSKESTILWCGYMLFGFVLLMLLVLFLLGSGHTRVDVSVGRSVNRSVRLPCPNEKTPLNGWISTLYLIIIWYEYVNWKRRSGSNFSNYVYCLIYNIFYMSNCSSFTVDLSLDIYGVRGINTLNKKATVNFVYAS